MSATIENPDAANAAMAKLRDERVTTQATRREYASTKARLEQKRDEQRRLIDVLDEPVEFRPVGVGVSRDAIKLRQRAMDGDESAEADLIDLVFETLADHAADDEMDEDFWGGFQMSTIQSVFEELVMTDLDDAEREQIEQFRS